MSEPLAKMGEQAVIRQPTTMDLIQTALVGGVTTENVGVIERLAALRREEIAAVSKANFNRDFFALKRDIAKLNFYADKEAKNNTGKVMYVYCSETEMSDKLEPVLDRHNFSMLFSQERDGDTVTAVVTLIHVGGHEHTSRFTVRVGSTNSAKDATAADAGSTTSAWRHLVMKLFGLKSRISDVQDPRLIGDLITETQAMNLQIAAQEVGMKEVVFLRLAGVTAGNPPSLEDYLKIKTGSLGVLENVLAEKAKQPPKRKEENENS